MSTDPRFTKALRLYDRFRMQLAASSSYPWPEAQAAVNAIDCAYRLDRLENDEAIALVTYLRSYRTGNPIPPGILGVERFVLKSTRKG